MKIKKGYIIFALLALAVSGIGLSRYTKVADAQITVAAIPELSGSAYSANFGTISFNCKTASGCTGSNYKVTVDSNGFLHGYAWANPRDSVAGTDNVGWLKFGGLSGFPTTDPTATAINARIVGNPGNQRIIGWARFCAPAVTPTGCAGATGTNSGGWDGWVSFDGTSRNVVMSTTPSPAGSTNYPFSGYAWSADVVGTVGESALGIDKYVGPGWIDMSGVKYEGDPEPEDPQDVPLTLYLNNTGASTSHYTSLTYSTDPGVNYTSCAGGMAVDNITGASQAVPNWTGNLLTLSGANITRTVGSVFVPYQDTHFRVDCFDADGNTMHADTFVSWPQTDKTLELCITDSTGLLSPSCGSGGTVSQTYPYNSTYAKLAWKSNITGANGLVGCEAVSGTGTTQDWDNGAFLQPNPTTTYSTPKSFYLLAGSVSSTTTYQMKCVDPDNHIDVFSNTVIAIRASQDLHPALNLEGKKTGTSSFVGAHTFTTAIQLPLGGGSVDLQWNTTDIFSMCTVYSSNNTWFGTRNPSGTEGPFPITGNTIFQIDCPTGTSGTTSGGYLTDRVYVKVIGDDTPWPPGPSGPKKPIFIEF